MSEQIVTPDTAALTVPNKDAKINLLDLNRQQMREFFKNMGEKPFRADQSLRSARRKSLKSSAPATAPLSGRLPLAISALKRYTSRKKTAPRCASLHRLAVRWNVNSAPPLSKASTVTCAFPKLSARSGARRKSSAR